MTSDILDRLDQIERSSGSYSDLVLEAERLMETFATGPGEVAVLVSLYGGSLTPCIANALSFLVARRAETASQEMAQLVLDFIGRFRCWGHVSTVVNSLTAVQHCLHYVDVSVGEALRSLSPFLRGCLDYTGPHWVIVKGHALALLSIVRDRDLTSAIFAPDELRDLRQRIRQLCESAGEELGAELQDIPDFIEE